MFTSFPSVVPITTPFKNDFSIDFEAYVRHLHWLLERGVDGIVVFGTTGETPTLTEQEKLDILSLTIKEVRGQVPVIACSGTNSTQYSLELTQKCKDLGADAALLIVPYCNQPSQEGCIYHFTKLNEIDMPLLLYHHPERTGAKLTIPTVEKILSLSNFIGLKDCSQNTLLFQEISKKFPRHYLFSGSDYTIIDEIQAGANGTIGACINVIPKQWNTICKAALHEKEIAKNNFIHIQPLLKAMYSETNPCGIKYAMTHLGLCHNVFRPPLVPMAKHHEEMVDLHAHLLQF